MPVVTCPKCPTKLKVPDGASGNTKCPKCATVFSVSAPAAGSGFEVVDDKPAPKPPAPAAPAAGSRPVMKPLPQKAEEPEFEDEKPKKRSRDDDDDDDDDRPRKKKRRDDDDDDDRPRSKKRRSRDDDDDDDDDRPRKKKGKKSSSRYDDDDDDDWQPKKSSKRAEFAKAKTGMLLVSISMWLYLGSLAVMTLFVIISWGGSDMSDAMVLPGLAGLGNWITAGVGLGFCIAGPKSARPMAIAAASVAGAHLLLIFMAANDGGSLFIAGRGSRSSSMEWGALVSLLPAVDTSLAMLVYNSKNIGDNVLTILGGACELARFILIMILLGKLAQAARDPDTAAAANKGMIIGIIVTSGLVVVFLLFSIILREGKFSSISTIMNLSMAMITIVYLAHALSMIAPAMAAMQTKDACNR